MHLCKFQTHSQMAIEMIIRATFDGWSWLQNSVFTQSKTFVHKLLTNYNVEEPGVYSHKQMLKISPIWGPAYMARPKYGVQKPTLSTLFFLSDFSIGWVSPVKVWGKSKHRDTDETITSRSKKRLTWEISGPLYLFLCPMWPRWISLFSLLFKIFFSVLKAKEGIRNFLVEGR